MKRPALAASLACAALLAGCADTQGRFDEFTDRYNTIHEGTTSSSGSGGGGGGSACALPEAGAADGDFLFSLSAKISPKKPIIFLVKLTTAAMGDGLGLSMNVQPLKAADRKTPTGTAVDVGPYQVAADGAFDAALPTLIVPGDANPISGSELEAQVTFIGSLCAPADLVCGDVTGNATRPIPLDLKGSTFAAVRIEDPNAYPEAVINCAKDPAPLMP